jgi:hypothetical protein
VLNEAAEVPMQEELEMIAGLIIRTVRGEAGELVSRDIVGSIDELFPLGKGKSRRAISRSAPRCLPAREVFPILVIRLE